MVSEKEKRDPKNVYRKYGIKRSRRERNVQI